MAPESPPFDETSEEDHRFIRRSVEAAIQIGLLFILASYTIRIISPFITPVLWGMIISVALYPVYRLLASALGNREKTAAVIITITLLSVLLVPAAFFLESAVSSARSGVQHIENGEIEIPAPPQNIREWPLVGARLYRVWNLASVNLDELIEQNRDQLTNIAAKTLPIITGLGMGVLQFTLAILISGAFLARSESAAASLRRVFKRFAGERGSELVRLGEQTIRSVAVGVVGIAIIQASLGGLGMLAVGVPAAHLWSLLILIVAIVQAPPLLVLAPVIAYVFSTSETTPAVIFMIWSLLVSVSDSFLKPILLGRGLSVPMIVILIGAIGGLLVHGLTGLFVGPVILALAYEVFTGWVGGFSDDAEQAEGA